MDRETTGEALPAASLDLAAFVAAWRQRMRDEGLEFVRDGELDLARALDSRADWQGK